MASMLDIIKLDKNELKPVIKLIEKDGGDEVMVAEMFGNSMTLFGEGSEMHIRSTIKKHLQIARIELKHKRQGYGTRILKLLENYCKEKGFVAIEIESVLTKEMNCFCIKHGFELMPDYSGVVDGEIFYGSFIKYL